MPTYHAEKKRSKNALIDTYRQVRFRSQGWTVTLVYIVVCQRFVMFTSV